jgi:hypothetical protein
MRLLTLLTLAACTQSTVDVAEVPFAGELVGNAARVWVADGDRQSVWSMPVGARVPDVELELGEAPTRMLRVGDDLYVTLRASGEVVHLRGAEGTLRLVDRVAVGADPYDLAVLDDTLYVSLTQERALATFDRSLKGLTRIPVDGDPRWLHAAPERDTVFVTLTDRPAVVELDGTVHELPPVERFHRNHCVQRFLDARITGAPVYDPGRVALYVPTVLMDTQLVELPGNDVEGCAPVTFTASVAYYAPPPPPEDVVSRSTPVIAGFDLVVDHVGLIVPDNVEGAAFLRGAFGDLRFVPETETESDRLLFPVPTQQRLVSMHPGQCDSRQGFSLCPANVSVVGLGTTSVAPLGDEVRSWSPILRAVEEGPVHLRTDPLATPGPESPLPLEVREGRRWFHDATGRRITTPGAGMSCSACHVEGRSDGVTWQFEDFPRQTPSLVGGLSDTAPFTWTGDVDTVVDEAMATSSVRMGGDGMSNTHAGQVSAFLEQLPPVGRPERDAALVALGEALFFDARVACATCHLGDKGTDGEVHEVFGFGYATATPALAGVGATAPYLHDGSAETLYDVLVRARDGSMGDTSGLDEHELKALVAYLETW